MEFLLVEEEPHPLHVVERSAEGLTEGASLGRRSGHLGAAREPPHDVPGGGHKIGEVVEFFPSSSPSSMSSSSLSREMLSSIVAATDDGAAEVLFWHA